MLDAPRRLAVLAAVAVGLVTGAVRAQTRVTDIAKLKGQRTNKLMGFGLVIGLNGTGDSGDVNTTRRALIALHKRFEQPVLDITELDGRNVALVVVEASIPQHGAREGETVDVIVSALNGSTKSLKGGQLLTTPLQDASLSIPDIIALAGGRVDLSDPDILTRGIIRGGGTFEQDFFYTFIDKGYVTLVLDETQAGFATANLVARAINQELASPRIATGEVVPGRRRAEVEPDPAVAIGPKNIRVKIPPWELPQPAWVIGQILQTELFVMPFPKARIMINRTSGTVTVSGRVTIRPTVVMIPGLGTVTVGAGQQSAGAGVLPLDTQNTGGTSFQELLQTLTQMKLSSKQLIATIEQLHKMRMIPAELVYSE